MNQGADTSKRLEYGGVQPEDRKVDQPNDGPSRD